MRAFCRLWDRRRARFALLALILVSGVFVVATGTERALRGSSEFRGFRKIVQVSLIQGKNPYRDIHHVRAYPPTFSLFWAPFGLFPRGALADKDNMLAQTTPKRQWQAGLSAAAALILMTMMTFWSVKCLAASCRRDSGWPSCFTVLLWLLTGGLMLNSVVRCETDMIVLMLVAGGMALLLARDRPWEGGFLIGLAAIFKLTPALFGLYFLCRRQWRAAAGMLIAGVLGAVVLPVFVWGVDGAFDLYHTWVNDVVLKVAAGGTETFIGRPYRATNQSLTAAAVRFLSHCNAGRRSKPVYVNVADLTPARAKQVASALKLVVLVALMAVWIAAARQCSPERERILFALVPPAMLLISDISVGGHYAILAVPVGVLAAYWFEGSRERAGALSWGLPVALALVYSLVSDTLRVVSVPVAGALAILGLCMYLAVKLQRERAKENPLPSSGGA